MSETKPSKHYLPEVKLKTIIESPETAKDVVDGAFAYFGTIYEQNELLIAKNEKLENRYSLAITENATLQERIRTIGIANAYQILLGFFGGVLITVGVSIVFSTQDHSNPLGWFLFFSGFLIGLAAFIFSFLISRKPKKNLPQGDSE